MSDQVASSPSNPRARIIVLAVFGLAIGPWIVPSLFREISLWYVAAAKEAQLQGESEETFELLEQALSWNSNSREVREVRSIYAAESGNRSMAIDDANWLTRRYPNDPAVIQNRGTVLQELGEFALAVRDFDAMGEMLISMSSDETRQANTANAENAVAYARSLANVELEKALAEVERALDRSGGDVGLIDPRGLRRFLKALVKQSSEPKESVEEFRRLDKHTENVLRALARIGVRDSAPPDSAARVNDYREFRALVLSSLKENLDELELEEEASAVDEKLRDCEEAGLAESFYKRKKRLLNRLVLGRTSAGGFGDTRAWIYYRLGRLGLAARDIDEAIAQVRIDVQQQIANLKNDPRMEVEPKQYEARLRAINRQLAVLHYHRMEIMRALKRTQAAEASRTAIISLGFDPDTVLF